MLLVFSLLLFVIIVVVDGDVVQSVVVLLLVPSRRCRLLLLFVPYYHTRSTAVEQYEVYAIGRVRFSSSGSEVDTAVINICSQNFGHN